MPLDIGCAFGLRLALPRCWYRLVPGYLKHPREAAVQQARISIQERRDPWQLHVRTAREENRPPTHRRAPAHRPAAPPPNWQLRVARPAPGPEARALFAGAATIPRRGRALRLGPEPTDRVRGGARQNSQQLVPRPPDPPPVRDAPPPRALYFAPSLQPRSPASASAASAHRAAGRQLLSTPPAGAARGARLR